MRGKYKLDLWINPHTQMLELVRFPVPNDYGEYGEVIGKWSKEAIINWLTPRDESNNPSV